MKKQPTEAEYNAFLAGCRAKDNAALAFVRASGADAMHHARVVTDLRNITDMAVYEYMTKHGCAESVPDKGQYVMLMDLLRKNAAQESRNADFGIYDCRRNSFRAFMIRVTDARRYMALTEGIS